MLPQFNRLARRTVAISSLAVLAACGGGGGRDGGDNGGGPAPGGNDGDGRTYLIKSGPDATRDMIAAMVQAAPGDVIQFDCGFFELESSLQLINTEDVRVKGCGKDKTVLSFKNNNAPEGILAVNVHGLWIEDLTVLDTGGNGIEFRGVDHGTIRRVRAIWSSGGGRESATPITADNAFADNAKLLNVTCTDPATPMKWAEALSAQLESGVLVERDGDGRIRYAGPAATDAQGAAVRNELTIDRDIVVLANPEIAGLPAWVAGLVAAGGLAAALERPVGALAEVWNELHRAAGGMGRLRAVGQLNRQMKPLNALQAARSVQPLSPQPELVGRHYQH